MTPALGHIIRVLLCTSSILVLLAPPTWTPAGSLRESRRTPSTALLNDGTVLVCSSSTEYSATAERYDSTTGLSSALPSMHIPRSGAVATRLLDGRVFVAGGNNPGGSNASAEIFDPATNTWSPLIPTPTENGSGQISCLLDDGRVLVASGLYSPGYDHDQAYLYNPATNTCVMTGSLHEGRTAALAFVKLLNGRVFVAGGQRGANHGWVHLASCESWDPATGTWSVVGNMAVPRVWATATLLKDGRVLIAGGATGPGYGTATAEIYDPATGTIAPTGSMSTRRVMPTATLLADGRVLIAGGLYADGPGSAQATLATAEIYDPSTGTFSSGGTMTVPRDNHFAVPLGDGRVLVGAGQQWSLATGISQDHPSCEIFDPGNRDTTPPSVAVTSPTDGTVAGTNSIAVTLSVLDESGTSVTSLPAGISNLLPAGGGVVSGAVPLLLEGANQVSFSAEDQAGNVGGTSITVVRDTTAPAMTILSPTEGSILGDASVNVTVEVDDLTATSVSIGSTTAQLPAGGGQSQAAVDLVPGLNTVTVTAVDAAGNQQASVRHLTFNPIAPLVTIDSPADGAAFGPGQSAVAVGATVTHAGSSTVSSTPPGVEATLPPGGGTAGGTVSLVEGLNVVMVTAAGYFGTSGSASITVLLDTTAPAVAIVSPAAGAGVRGTIDLHATTVDPAPGSGVAHCDLLIDGVASSSFTVPPFEWQVNTTALSDGAHTFTVAAFDAMGNMGSSTRSVVVDNTAPGVTIASPGAGAYVSGTIPFTVSAQDGGAGVAAITMLAAGMPPSVDASATYATPVASDTLTGGVDTAAGLDGPLVLSVRVFDAAGNEGSATITVIVDNTAPDNALLAPADGAVVSGLLDIVAGSGDPNLASIRILLDDVAVGTSATSPFTVAFDTRLRLDGAMSIAVEVTDLAGNTSRCTAAVTVDNVAFTLSPQTLNLGSKGGANSITARLEGLNVAILLPAASHGVELRVPGGSPVPATAGFGQVGDDNGNSVPDATLKFDRQALIASIRAGIATGQIPANGNVQVTLVADSRFVIGTILLRIAGS